MIIHGFARFSPSLSKRRRAFRKRLFFPDFSSFWDITYGYEPSKELKFRFKQPRFRFGLARLTAFGMGVIADDIPSRFSRNPLMGLRIKILGGYGLTRILLMIVRALTVASLYPLGPAGETILPAQSNFHRLLVKQTGSLMFGEE